MHGANCMMLGAWCMRTRMNISCARGAIVCAGVHAPMPRDLPAIP